MDEVHVVRHKVLVEGLGIRRVAREMGVSRNTVRRYLAIAEPKRIESTPRRRWVWEKVGPRVEELLESSPRWTGGKQRLTAARLHEMLVAEGHHIGETLVKAAVAEWKRRRREVFVPLVYRPGELAEVDFFEVLVDVAGVRRKAHLFVMRLMYSGRDFAWLYERQDQVSFLDGHVRAFTHFGAVPQRIAYDNLKAAVAKILAGSERELAARFRALASHYVLEPVFCRPGTGHDKGGVESRGRAIRWQALVPIPAGENLDAISVAVLARLDGRMSDRLERPQDDAGEERRTIGERFERERGAMLPLPIHPFAPRRLSFVEVSRRSLVKVEGAHYSVPTDWAGLTITARVGPHDVELVGPSSEGARDGRLVVHPRRRFGARSVDYKHYLRELAQKPQAVRQVAAELVRDLGEPFGTAWRLLLDMLGPQDAARHFARILGTIERDGITNVAHRITRALERGEPLPGIVSRPSVSSRVASIDDLPPALRSFEIPSGRAADYDRWLREGDEEGAGR